MKTPIVSICHHKSPEEILLELQESYNRMDGQFITDKNKLKLNNIRKQIKDILTEFPELNQMVKLKNYNV